MLKIEPVRTDAQARAVEPLAWAFMAWLRDRYPDMLAEIDAYYAAQNFTECARDVRRTYGPPQGEALLASLDGTPVGIVMFKDKGDRICEMNRMFVDPSARGHGVGRALVEQLIRIATDQGFRRMRLSALDRHDEALLLYRKMGFGPDTMGDLEGTPDDPRVVSLMLDLTA